METPTRTTLRVGDWTVNPTSGQIARNGQTSRLEERTMRLLLCLAERAGEVVSIEDLLKRVWPDVTVSQDSVYQAVASLRRLLGDDPKEPAYIATVPRLGYRMVAKVDSSSDSTMTREPGGGHSTPADAPAMLHRHSRIHFVRAAAVALFLVILSVFLLVKRLTPV